MEKTNNEAPMNFEKLVISADKIRQVKAKKEKKPTISSKILNFNVDYEEDSPLKIAIVERINKKKLTYNQLYEYCAELNNGDLEKGKKVACNIINGLRYHHSMIDTTFYMLCGFLRYEIYLKPLDEDDEDYSADTKEEKEYKVKDVGVKAESQGNE